MTTKEYTLYAHDRDFEVKLTLNVDKCLRLLSQEIENFSGDDMPMIQSSYEYFNGKFDGDTDELLEWFACEFASKAVKANYQWLGDPYEAEDGYPPDLKEYVTLTFVETPSIPDYYDWSIS